MFILNLKTNFNNLSCYIDYLFADMNLNNQQPNLSKNLSENLSKNLSKKTIFNQPETIADTKTNDDHPNDDEHDRNDDK